MKKHILFILILFSIAVLIKLSGVFESRSVFCLEKDYLYKKGFNSLVIDKYIDSNNHCNKTLLLKDINNNKKENVYFINENSGFYEKARVNDTLFKEKNSLDIIINHEKAIHSLKYDCDE